MAKGKEEIKMLNALENVLFEEGVDEVFNLLLTYDYEYVRKNLSSEGYDLSSYAPKDYFLLLLSGACYDIEGGDEIGEFAELLENQYLDSIEVLDPASLISEPYYQLLQKVPSFKEKGIEFKMDKYAAFEPFLSKRRHFCEDFEVTPKPSIACFPTSTPFPALFSKGEPWMTLIPHEIDSMKEDLDALSGNVLIYGLGLGYAAYVASEKENVSNVTVVEKDRTILSFFERHVLPLFPHKEKIVLMEGDALDFASSHRNGSFDFLFADLWHTGEDGLGIYAKLKRLEGAAKANLYWVEEEMLLYFRRLYLRLFAYVKTSDKEYLSDIDTSPYYKDMVKAIPSLNKESMDLEKMFAKGALIEAIKTIIP